MSDESDQAGLILVSHFLRFPYEKFLDELHSSTESYDTSASSAAFFEVRNVLGSAEAVHRIRLLTDSVDRSCFGSQRPFRKYDVIN